MTLAAIATLLSQRIGLESTVISPRYIAKATVTRQAACQISDIKDYLKLIQTSEIEFAALVEEIVVPETWFFRDRKPFEYLKNYVRSQLPRNPSILRLLSMPCATGEEPYSIAITLLEAGLSPNQFIIDGIDISQRAIAKARQAVYPKNSFRGDLSIYQQQYFQPTESGYQLTQSIQKLVNFYCDNIVNFSLSDRQKYDIIFCRNLLIYLTDSASRQVLNTIDRLLLPSGLLFIGSSEFAKISPNRYTSVNQPFTFAYQKRETITFPDNPEGNREKKKGNLDKGIATPSTHKSVHETNLKQKRQKPNPPVSLSQPSVLAINLPQIRKLANEGEIEEAITLCQTYLTHHPTSGAAYILLGELYQANRDEVAAEKSFRKALYLEPNSESALIHLALIKENQGDWASADILQQRIQRLKQIDPR